jgi:hypothetical protein
MSTGNSVFKDLEPDDEVPEYLKHALVAEVDTIRNTMQIVTLFTEHFLSAITIGLNCTDNE